MANTSSARKRARQAEKRRVHNVSLRSRMRTSLKNVITGIKNGDADKAQEAFLKAVPVLDSAVNKGLVHKNKAARSKSRLNTKILALKAS